ncbi:Phytochrome-like protein cph2 [compost metagenome]
MRHQLLIVFLLFMLTGCMIGTTNSTYCPAAVAGVIDLSDIQEDQHAAAKLNGEWAFYWSQLLEPMDIEAGRGELSGYIDMPSNWENYELSGAKLPGDGYATFVLNLQISEPNRVKALSIPKIYSNYKLWINGQLEAVSGVVGTDRSSSVPQKMTQMVYFSSNTNRVQLVLQISNYHDLRGGMWEPIIYGSAPALSMNHDHHLAERSLLIGVLGLSGVYHLGIGLFRKKDFSMLYFGLFCLNDAIRNILIDEVLITKYFANFPWELGMKLEYITLYLEFVFLALFTLYLFPKQASKKFTKTALAIAGLYVLVTLILHADVYVRFLIYYQIFMLIGLLYALIVFVRAAFQREDGAVYALVGFMVFEAVVAFDLLKYIFRYSERSVYSIGIVIFIICFSIVLSKKLSYAFNTTEQLAKELTELNEGLDRKVHERTLVIEESRKQLIELNRQLQEWSMADGLTGAANRRHFDEYLGNQLIQSIEEHKPISLLLIDIDYFKRYNDTYGHIQGDRCLQAVVNSIKSSFPPTDGLIARYGGEEFAVVLPGYSADRATETADKVCALVKQLRISHENSKVADVVTVSVGVATAYLKEDKEYTKLIKSADNQLYKAKSMGRNQVCTENDSGHMLEV